MRLGEWLPVIELNVERHDGCPRALQIPRDKGDGCFNDLILNLCGSCGLVASPPDPPRARSIIGKPKIGP
jgi:hypothetical protein